MSVAQQVLSNPDTFTGTVISVRFYNPGNGWAVLGVRPKDDISDYPDAQFTAVGSCVNPREGDEYEFRGRFVLDPKYGRQFRFDSASVLLPSTRKGVIRYLASIATGVGEVKASRIVGALGDDCLGRLHADPSTLDGLNFLTAAQRDEIRAHLREHSTVAEVSGLVCREGITPALAARIVTKFGPNAVDIVKTDPYKLTEMDGIGFLTADRIAMAVNVASDAPARIRAAILHLLAEAQSDGHCFLRPSDLVREMPALLGTDIPVSRTAAAVQSLIEAGMLVRDGDDIYLKEIHRDEVVVADRIGALAIKSSQPPENLDDLIRAVESGEVL